MTLKFHYLNRPLINYQQAWLILNKKKRKNTITDIRNKTEAINTKPTAFKDNKCE